MENQENSLLNAVHFKVNIKFTNCLKAQINFDFEEQALKCE